MGKHFTSGRLCAFCQTNKLGDEFHYLFEWPSFDLMVTQYIPTLYLRYI